MEKSKKGSKKIEFDKKDVLEIIVCTRFITLYNVINQRRFGRPWNHKQLPGLKDPPDCVSFDQSSNSQFQLEVTTSSPEEKEENALKDPPEFDGSYLATPEEIDIRIGKLFEICKGKSDNYKGRKIDLRNLTLLLDTVFFRVTGRDLENWMGRILIKDWQEKFRNLGFKDIWFVGLSRIYRLHPV